MGFKKARLTHSKSAFYETKKELDENVLILLESIYIIHREVAEQ